VGWSLKPRMTADIVTDAHDDGVVPAQTAGRADHHFGSRSQYASQRYFRQN